MGFASKANMVLCLDNSFTCSVKSPPAKDWIIPRTIESSNDILRGPSFNSNFNMAQHSEFKSAKALRIFSILGGSSFIFSMNFSSLATTSVNCFPSDDKLFLIKVITVFRKGVFGGIIGSIIAISICFNCLFNIDTISVLEKYSLNTLTKPTLDSGIGAVPKTALGNCVCILFNNNSLELSVTPLARSCLIFVIKFCKSSTDGNCVDFSGLIVLNIDKSKFRMFGSMVLMFLAKSIALAHNGSNPVINTSNITKLALSMGSLKPCLVR